MSMQDHKAEPVRPAQGEDSALSNFRCTLFVATFMPFMISLNVPVFEREARVKYFVTFDDINEKCEGHSS